MCTIRYTCGKEEEEEEGTDKGRDAFNKFRWEAKNSKKGSQSLHCLMLTIENNSRVQ